MTESWKVKGQSKGFVCEHHVVNYPHYCGVTTQARIWQKSTDVKTAELSEPSYISYVFTRYSLVRAKGEVLVLLYVFFVR